MSCPVHGAWGYWSLEGHRDAVSALVSSHDWCHGRVVPLYVLHTAARLGTKQQRFRPRHPGHLYRVKFKLREWQFCVLLAQPRVISLLENRLQSRAKEQVRRAIAAAPASKTQRSGGRGHFLSAQRRISFQSHRVCVKPHRVNLLKGRRRVGRGGRLLLAETVAWASSESRLPQFAFQGCTWNLEAGDKPDRRAEPTQQAQ